MDIFTLKQVQCFPVPLEELWDFFMQPSNLMQITPPEVKFKVLSKPEEIKLMKQGLIICYKISPFLGIYMNWTTEITELKEKEFFVDVQISGPYKKWIHRHNFKAIEGGVEMTDELEYEMPFGFLGKIAHTLFVQKQVEKIFKYRKGKLDELFSKRDVSHTCPTE
jgi:ligand-binding SRPBCC domain-containing protein